MQDLKYPHRPFALGMFALENSKTVQLDTLQAERIQHDYLKRVFDNEIEYYVSGRYEEIQAIYEWNTRTDGPDHWHLSEKARQRYVTQPAIDEIEREIYSGLNYLTKPEETAFKLTCGLMIEDDEHDASRYVLHGRNGGEIDRHDNVRDLAECVLDTLSEEDR